MFADDPDHGLHSLSYTCCCLCPQLQLDLNLFFEFCPPVFILVINSPLPLQGWKWWSGLSGHITQGQQLFRYFVIFHVVILTSELFSKTNLVINEWKDQQVFTLKDFFASTFTTFAFKGTPLHICCWKIFDRKCKSTCRWSCTLSTTWSSLSENAFSWSTCSNQLFFGKYVYQAQLTMQEFFHITFLEFALKSLSG